ncbi:TfoX/Sxy family protein [Novosphingobium bradum]|uniref:TfoX/Sxy family protein n=1 Tax=Novosphingobium bradum TaxID=1737444 RepID=A0ABV7IR65_9SPHN
MATDPRTAEFLGEQLAALGGLSIAKMFGEYGVWLDGKTVALICGDQLFVKPTEPGRAFIGEVVEAPPYRGAKPSLLIDDGRWDEAEWLCDLLQITADALPARRPKRRKSV